MFSNVDSIFKKLFNWLFAPDSYNFCNFVRSTSDQAIDLHKRSCVQKLHACMHAGKKIESVLLPKANVMFGWKSFLSVILGSRRSVL